jgi:hypothetical protein
MANQVYILKNKKFTEIFPQWELLKVGSSNNPNNRVSTILCGLNEEDYEMEIITNDYLTNIGEHCVRLREGIGTHDVHISPFHRIVGRGRTYKPNISIKLIDDKMYKYLNQITDVKTKLSMNWGVTEWLIRPNKNWIAEQQTIMKERAEINSLVQYTGFDWENFYHYAKILIKRYFRKHYEKIK